MTIQNALYRRNRYPGVIQNGLVDIANRVPGLVYWFDADFMKPYYGNGATVNYWLDRSGHEYHAWKTNETPTFVTSAVNGHAAISLASKATLSVHPGSWNAGMWFMVLQRDGAANDDAIMIYSDTEYSYLQYGDDWTSANGATNSVPFAASTWKLKSCSYDNTDIKQYTNGSAESNMVNNRDMFIENIGPTNDYAAEFDVAELLVYSEVPTTANRQYLDGYLNQKYNLW